MAYQVYDIKPTRKINNTSLSKIERSRKDLLGDGGRSFFAYISQQAEVVLQWIRTDKFWASYNGMAIIVMVMVGVV